jgi:hypothetical protein
MDKKQAARILRPLRGTHVFVMMAYLMIQKPLTVAELCECTGLSDDVLRPALKYLEGEGYLCKQRGEHGRESWLPASDSFLGQLFQSPRLSDSGSDVVVVVAMEGENNLYSATTTNKLQSPRLSDSGSSEINLLNLAALKAAGIVGKKARELAALPWVTVAYIEAHAEQVKHEFWDNPQGMIIHRISEEMPVNEIDLRRKETVSIKPTMRDWLGQRRESDDLVHDDDCNCLDCRYSFPERFCIYRHTLPPTFRDRDIKGGPCGALVVPGHKYCKNHMSYESEEK